MDKTSSHIEELEALFELLEKGAISKDEYEAQKKILLSSHIKQEQIETENAASEQIDLAEKIDDEPTPYHHLPSEQNRQIIIAKRVQPALQQNDKSNSNSVKIILIIVVGLIILAAMYFVFISGSQSASQQEQATTASAASMASSVITTQPQQASSPASETATVEEDNDVTGLELNKRTPAELITLLTKYQQERIKAEAKLRKVWANLDADFKSSIFDEQKKWDSTALLETCSLTGYKTVEAQQVANLYCESNVLDNRADELLQREKEEVIRIKEEKADNSEKMAADALQRLELTWSTIPEDVQKNLDQTYQQWYSETSEYCLSRPTANTVMETKINFNNCMIKKSEDKIKELNGYKI